MSNTINHLIRMALTNTNDGETLNAVRAAASKIKASGYSAHDIQFVTAATSATSAELAASKRDLLEANDRLNELAHKLTVAVDRPSTKAVTHRILDELKIAGEKGVSMSSLSAIKGFDTRLTGMIISSGGAFWVGKEGDNNRLLVSERFRHLYPDAPPPRRSVGLLLAERILSYGADGVTRSELNADNRRLSELLAVDTVVERGGVIYHSSVIVD